MSTSQWQPIETAPEDGTSIIVCTDYGVVGEARFFGEVSQWYWAGFEPGDYTDGAIDSVTCWQPLPEPPAEAGGA